MNNCFGSTRPIRKVSGFTLIELLVVIAIIAILAAILFPVFSRARENARRSSCQSNLKQIGLGIMQYTQDYDERMPINYGTGYHGTPYSSPEDYHSFSNPPAGHGTWMASVFPYTKSWQILACPSATPDAVYPPVGNDDTSYNANGMVITIVGVYSQTNSVSLAAIPNVASTIAVQERQARMPFCSIRPFRDTTTTGSFALDPSFGGLHFDGGNYLFCDGHVKWRKQNSVTVREFGLDSDNKDAGRYNTLF